MLKLTNRSSSQRAKSLTGKGVFQACLLLVLCIWLMYQVKQTYEGKKERIKDNEESLEDTLFLRGKKAVKFGRKDLDPQEAAGLGIGLAKEMVKDEERGDDSQDEVQDRPDDEETEQLAEDAIDEDDREKENEVEDSANAVLDDLFGDEGEKNIADSWEEN